MTLDPTNNSIAGTRITVDDYNNVQNLFQQVLTLLSGGTPSVGDYNSVLDNVVDV